MKRTTSVQTQQLLQQISVCKITEVENLVSAGHGGQVRGEHGILPTIDESTLDPTTRSARPTQFNADYSFDEKAYDEYVGLMGLQLQ